MQVKCNIITSAISSLAKEIGKSDAYTCNLVSAWQTDMSRGNIIPTKYQLDKYIKANQATVKELELAIPCYNYEQENGQSKLVRHEGNEITIVHFDDTNKLFNKLFNDFKNDPYINDIKDAITNPNEAYRFLLWREQSIIQNGYYDDYRDSAKATNDALTKLRLWKKASPSSQQKQAQTSGQKENKELPTKNDTINIYAGTNENADLSNFAVRPFVVTNVGPEASAPIAGNFKTVEGAFQAQKLAYTNNYTEIEEKEIISKLEKASGSEARRIGRSILGLNSKSWDSVSSGLMQNLLMDSFQQNPQALQRLLDTGSATLTHTQDKGKWGTEFPKLLMEVRKELRKEHPELIPSTASSNNQSAINSQLIDQLKASGITVLSKADMEKYLSEKGKPDPTYALQAAKENQKELDDIKAKAIKNGTFMKAPNGKPTNLTERQWLQVRTKNFINWFGDWINDPANASKIVDENGEPLVVYHGTDSTFTIFDPTKQDGKHEAFYFTDSQEMAKSYKDGTVLMPLFLNVRDSYEVDAKGRNWNNIELDFATKAKTPIEFAELILKQQQVEIETAKRGRYDEFWGKFVKDEEYVNKKIKAITERYLPKLYKRYLELQNEHSNNPIKNIKRILEMHSIMKTISNIYKNAYSRNSYGKSQERVSTRDLDLVLNDKEGIIIQNVKDYGSKVENPLPHNVYVVYQPNQIKAATDNNGEFSTENDDIRMFKTPDGEVYGFVDKEGNIYLDENVISPEHPIHEYTHLWDRALQKTNSKLWNRGVELMKQTSLWKTIEEDANYGTKWKNENLSQEELDNRIASEVHARFVGEGGAKLLEELAKEKGQEGIIAKLKNWILEAWKSLKATFSDWSEDEINKLTLKDFNHMTVRDFAEGINPNTINQFNQQNQQSMNNLSAETDSSDNSMPEIGTGAESLLKVDTDTPMAKLAMDINPIQRRARVDMLAHQFSEKLDELVQQKVDELKAELNQEMLGERRPNVLNRIKKQSQLYDNAFEGRKAIMSTAGTSAKEIFDMIKSDLEEAVKDTDSYTPEEIDAYQKVIDNFDLLVNETCAKLESTENVRITFSQNNYHNGKSVSKVVSSNIEDTAQKEDADEEAFDDDDTGKRVEGNAGWSYHARFVDPRTSISKTTKHIIANIPMLDEDGEYMVDDLGYQRYIDENYAHNVLLNELSSLISPEDFVTTDKDRDPIAFPALEKATEKYPWIQQIIDTLYEHNDYISAFYSDFRKDYIPYWMQYYGKDSMGNWQWYNKQMNAPMALESTLNEIRSDYEHGYRLDQYSVYSVGNKLEVDNANIGLGLLNSGKAGNRGALTVLNDPNFDATDAEDKEIDMVIEKPTQVFRMLGVNVNKNIITALLGTKDSTEQLKTALNAAKRIFEGIVGGKVAEGADLITAFDEDYKTIAKIVGSVSEIANVGSFRNDDKTYYSYSAPNYMDTMFKKFKSDDRRQDYIDREFKKYDWFYDKDKKEWYSEWLHILEGNPDDEDFDEECQNIRFNMQMKELKTIKDKTNDPNNRHADYSDWQPMQIKQHFVQEYFSAGRNKNSKTQYAWYNFPIFSDSPVAKFIKFKRYVASRENGSVEDQLLPLFRKVVKQELGRMKLVNQRREKGAEPISNFDDDKYMRGAKFCFFPDFEFYYVKEDGTIYDGFGKTKNEIDPSYVSLKKKLAELADAKDTSAIDTLIDAAVKYDMDDLYTKFLQDFGTVSITEDKGIRLDNDKLTKLGENTLEDLKKSGAISDSINFSDALHEYFWNQAYATTQIIEITTTDLAFYKDAGDFQKRFKEIYAAGTKLNTLSKYGKKFYKTIYLVDNLITSPSYNDIKKSLDDAVQAHHITKLDEESILKQLEEINVADAQAYRSLSSIRSVLDMMGQWTPEMETTYNNIRKGDWNMNDLNTIWQTLKPFVYTQIDSSDGIGGRMKVPHQNKNSEFALLYAYVAVATGSSRDGHIKTKTSGKLKAMADFMEEKGIDVIQFQSAVKAGNQGDINLNMSHKKLADWALKKHMTGTVNINDLEKKFRAEQNDKLKNGEISQSEFNDIIDSMQPDYKETYDILEKAAFTNGRENEEVVHTIPYDDYIIQQPTPEHLLDARAVFGSQFRNLVISDLPDDFKLKIHGKELGKKEILDLYNSLIVENLLDDFDRLKERFENIEKFQEALLQEVNGNPKYGRDMLDALQLVDVKDENGNTHKEFNIPLYNPATTLKIQELVDSMFKNAITKQHVKGGACILVSSFGFTDELHVLHNSDGSIKGMECYMPAYSKDFFQPFMKTDENGNPYLDPTELPNELRRGIGYRIPTEDKYSMAPLYIKGFLPQENGSEIMLPAETTLFSGEDYDVDKKFLMLPEYKVQPYDMRKAYKEYSETHNVINKIGNLFKGTSFDTITDEDQSFNNWFSNLSNEEKEGYKLDKPIITKIKYDLDKKPQEQSRAARNNMIFDLAYSILTSKDTAEKIHNPGSFDKAKREAKMAKIAGNKQLLAIWSKENHTTDNVEATVKSLLDASLKKMKDFLDKYDKERTQMTVDTFIYNHKQNMTGAALIGMYANNTSMQAKFQQTSLAIKDDFTFSINAKKRKEIAKEKKIETDGRIKSLHDITSPLDERISKNCANFSAASVDNVKDPVLADLRQNTNTANIMGMLLRAGLSIQEASLMFQQPIVAQWIDETDGAKIDNLDKLIESYSQQLVDNGGEVIDKEKVIREHDFTTEELLTNVVKGLDANDTTNLAENIKTAYLFLNAAHIADDLAELTRISRADSPNGAIKPSIAGFFGQLMRVRNYHEKAKTDGFTLTGISDCVKNNQLLKLYDNRDKMREILLESSMPVLQAFYSLGIESARHYLSPYFTQLTNYMSQVTRRVGNNSGFDNVPDQVLNTLYKDFIYYALTHSKIFGNGIEVNGKSTYEDKRKFYLYEYPKHLMATIADNPDIAQLTAIKKLEVKDGVIRMTNSGRLTQPARESLQRDFEMLLYMDNKAAQQMAIDLFMYSFYQEGFNFGPNTIGGMFSTLFLDSIPEYVQALRNIPKEMPNSEDVSTYFDDFLNQFYANRYNMSGVLPIRTVSSSDFTQLDDKNKITVPINKVKNWKTQSAYNYVGLKDEDGTFLGYYSVPITSGKSVTYTKLSTINDSSIDGKVFNVTKYDANSTTDEIAESLKDEIVLRDKAGMLKTDDDVYGSIDSITIDDEISPDSTDDTAKAAMNDEVQNQAPADIKQKANEDVDIPSDIFGEIGSLTSDDIYTMEGGQNTLDTKMC